MPALFSLARRFGHYRWFAVLGRAYAPVDRLVGRLTKGRFVGLGGSGAPSLLITTTGRNSGKPRTNPLLYARDGDAFAVVASNWGQPHHPAWSTNLLAHPDAVLTLDGTQIPVRGHLVSGEERARLWRLLLATWPGYAAYEDRASGRRLRVFRLDRR